MFFKSRLLLLLQNASVCGKGLKCYDVCRVVCFGNISKNISKKSDAGLKKYMLSDASAADGFMKT